MMVYSECLNYLDRCMHSISRCQNTNKWTQCGKTMRCRVDPSTSVVRRTAIICQHPKCDFSLNIRDVVFQNLIFRSGYGVISTGSTSMILDAPNDALCLLSIKIRLRVQQWQKQKYTIRK